MTTIKDNNKGCLVNTNVTSYINTINTVILVKTLILKHFIVCVTEGGVSGSPMSSPGGGGSGPAQMAAYPSSLPLVQAPPSVFPHHLMTAKDLQGVPPFPQQSVLPAGICASSSLWAAAAASKEHSQFFPFSSYKGQYSVTDKVHRLNPMLVYCLIMLF